MKVIFCNPVIARPHDAFIAALEASVPYIEAAGWEHGLATEIGNPYISAARATMTRKALDASADVIVYLDHDLSWDAPDLLKLLETPGEVIAGTYRFKHDGPEEYMGSIYSNQTGRPMVRPSDGCIKADRVPAGFLKVTKEAIGRFMAAYPNLVYGPPYNPSVDLFNHGAHKGIWYGEDYAFSRNWEDAGGELWIVPNLNIDHHTFATKDEPSKVFKGNFHEFLLRQPQPTEAASLRAAA